MFTEDNCRVYPTRKWINTSSWVEKTNVKALTVLNNVKKWRLDKIMIASIGNEEKVSHGWK